MTRNPALEPCYSRPMLRSSRTYLVLVSLGIGCSGCAEVLGLEGLTFDRSEEPAELHEEVDDASGIGGQPESDGSGGTSERISIAGAGAGVEGQRVPPDEYPKIWGPGALIATSYQGLQPPTTAPDSLVWVKRGSGAELLVLRMSAEQDDLLGESRVSEGWTHLLAPRQRDQRILIGYQAGTGFLDWGSAPVADSPFESQRIGGSPGRTHLVLTGPADGPSLFSYDAESQTYRIGPADLSLASPEIEGGTWEGTWTDALAFAVGDQLGILRLNQATGDTEFLPLAEGALGAPQEWLSLSSGWSIATSYRTDGGMNLLLYWGMMGALEIYSTDSATGDVSVEDEILWRSGLSDIVPVTISDAPWALTYDSQSGTVDLQSLDSPETSQGPVVK